MKSGLLFLKCVQYIQNTINKAEIDKIKNKHKDIDAEGRRRVIMDMSKGVCMCRHHIWKVRISLIHRPSVRELLLIKWIKING